MENYAISFYRQSEDYLLQNIACFAKDNTSGFYPHPPFGGFLRGDILYNIKTKVVELGFSSSPYCLIIIKRKQRVPVLSGNVKKLKYIC